MIDPATTACILAEIEATHAARIEEARVKSDRLRNEARRTLTAELLLALEPEHVVALARLADAEMNPAQAEPAPEPEVPADPADASDHVTLAADIGGEPQTAAYPLQPAQDAPDAPPPADGAPEVSERLHVIEAALIKAEARADDAEKRAASYRDLAASRYEVMTRRADEIAALQSEVDRLTDAMATMQSEHAAMVEKMAAAAPAEPKRGPGRPRKPKDEPVALFPAEPDADHPAVADDAVI